MLSGLDKRVLLARLRPMAGFLLLSLMVGLLGYALIQSATRKLLAAEARIDAQQWSNVLSRSIPDLNAIIAGGEAPPATNAFLEHAREARLVTSFQIYDTRGNLKLLSGGKIDDGSPTVAAHAGQELTEAMRNGTPVTLLRRGATDAEPAYYATAIVPVMDEFRTIGWIVANIDQSSRQALFFEMTSRISAIICALLMAASIFGFWYRNRERALVEKKLEWLSQRDQLTGLMNKATCLAVAQHKLAAAHDNRRHIALILCEISSQSGIALTHGQDAEDHLVQISAQRLIDFAAGRLELARIGRLSFAACIDTITDPMAVLSLAKDMTAALGQPVSWRDQQIAFHAHAGIALSSSDGETPDALLRSAEMALQSAQEQGSPGYGFFNPEIAKDTRRRGAIQRAVAAAAASMSFRLDYQPVYNIRTGELNGFEALIRMHDSELGSVSPAEFIPVAEQMGLINSIGAWCLQEACRTASEWPAHLMVAVNLSPSQFLTGSLINDVRHALEQARFPAYRLEVEITEGTLLNDSELVMGQLRLLRDMGVAVALDDFGTGYSSLGYLWKFPFSKLKIDRSFVQALDESQSAKGILRSIVKLGHGLGLAVTAEGIETSKQFTTLRDLGCDLAQGYLLDRPARVTDLAAIIMRNFANGLPRRLRDQASSDKSAA